MRDPTRIIDDRDEANGLGRDLLRAGRGQTLSARDRAQVWAELSATLVAPAASAAASAGATKALTSASLLKGVVVAVALSGGALVGVRAARRPAPEVVPAVVTEPSRAAPAIEPPLPVTSPTPAPDRAPHVRRAPAAGEEAAVPRLPASRLAAEAQLVLDARRDLREGNPASALRRLETARPELVGGALAQEREALTIEALDRSGQTEAAARRARAFLRAYPRSPHAASVSTFARDR
jgi:hypothetical protein